MTPLCRRALRRSLCALPAALALALSLGASSASALLLPNTANPQWSIMPMEVGAAGVSAPQGQILPHTGPVLGATHVYLIYWDPLSPPPGWPVQYPQSTKLLTSRYLFDLAADSNTIDNSLALDTFYQGPGNAHAGNTPGTTPGYELQYEGSYTDQITPYPTQNIAGDCTDPNHGADQTDYCLTDPQIQTMLQQYVSEYALPTGPNDVYLVLTPPDVTTCLDSSSTMCSDVPNRSTTTNNPPDVNNGYCAYHGVIANGGNEILYGQIPWPFPNIPAADLPQALPDATAIADVKDCQPDGGSAVSLPNGLAVQQPLLSNEAAIEVDFGDVLINEISHELNAIITDPTLTTWFDSAGLEGPDKCEASGAPPGADPGAWFIFAGLQPGPLNLPYGVGQDGSVLNTFNTAFSDGNDYYLQSMFDPALKNTPAGSDGMCMPYAQELARFPIPAKVDPNQLVGFDPSTSISTLGIQQYSWNFGDGSATATYVCPTGAAGQPSLECNPSVFHAFTTPGTYSVTLSITDFGGNVATASQSLTVLGAAPAGGGGGGSGGGSGGSGGSGSGGGAGAITTSTTTTATATTAAKPPTPPAAPASVAPKVVQAVVGSSLSKALKSGIVVHYSVTEQVAGHFQVLLDARTARRLGIKSPVLKGKYNGLTNPIQIGTALLESTKAGNSGIAITFSKSVATKLRHAKTLSLTVRLVAHNIAGQQVVVTTTVKLH